MRSRPGKLKTTSKPYEGSQITEKYEECERCVWVDSQLSGCQAVNKMIRGTLHHLATVINQVLKEKNQLRSLLSFEQRRQVYWGQSYQLHKVSMDFY